ncbi:quercetin dioxygenase-like cupin family protein [Pedobacter sp. CG_S7]|uniref:cupin domain-containing protein n=1 Tax=Pedobacter sp. CG_S7 TaxID=3143930 RepID=UPI003398E512
MDTMTTVSQVLNQLKEQGYTVDFNLDDNCIICSGNSLKIHPDDFEVDKHYRFEGMSDPADEAVVYAISSAKHNLKGVLVNGYGIYSDAHTDEIIKTLYKKTLATKAAEHKAASSTKFNEATPLRPEGDRALDAPILNMDLNAFKIQIKEEQSWKTSDRTAITIFKTDVMRVVLIAMHEGAEMKQHTAPGVITVQVLEGHISFHTSIQTVELRAAQMIALHTGIPHSVFANQESIFLLTMAMSNS